MTPDRVRRFGLTLVFVLGAFAAQVALAPMWGDRYIFLFFFPAILAAAWRGGLGPGLLATGLSALLVIPLGLPAHGLRLAEAIALAAFVVVGVFMSVVAEAAERGRQAVNRRHLESRRLATIVESSDDAIVSKTPGGTITSWNPGAERVFGYTAEEAIGRPITMLFPADRIDEERVFMAAIGRGERIEHFQTERVRKDGARISVDVTLSAIRDDRGAVIGIAKIARDITEQKRLEAARARVLELEQAARAAAEEASRAKDEFLATLSHELRTPLNAIIGWIAMLRGQSVPPARIDAAYDIIARNALAQQRLIEDLLDVSRIITGKLRLDVQPVDPAAVVRAALESIRPAADAKEIRLQMTLDPRAARIMGDPDRLQQVVWNLLSNAVKFTPRRGRVQVGLRHVSSHVEIVVADTGAGMSPEMVPRVFDRFVQADSSSTRRYGGLGIGLALVRQLVELHGGTVTARSEGVGRGSTFVIRLPVSIADVGATSDAAGVHPRSSAELPGAEIRSPGALAGVRVLVIDDEPDSVELLTTILSAAGAEVVASGSAADGFEAVRTRKPHVVVSDIEMPSADGYALARRLRASDDPVMRRVPAVALTAYGRLEDRVRALQAGYDLHLVKPVDPLELIAVLARLSAR